MRVRFFSDWGPNDVPRVLVGISPEDGDRGQAREAVHVCTQADIDAYPAAYAEYEKTVHPPQDTEVHTATRGASSETSPASAGAGSTAETSSTETASSAGSMSSTGSSRSRSSGSSSG